MKYDWQIIGHEKILNKLESDLKANNIASAMLFIGPNDIGKAKICKTLAQILQTFQTEQGFSFDHPIAKEIRQNNFADVITVDALWQQDKLTDFEIISKTSNFNQTGRKKSRMKSDTISVDDIRTITERIYGKKNSDFKICFIRNIHRMTTNASNAFLKVLEEPPEKTVFLLTTTHQNLVLPTLISRTRVCQLNLLADKILESFLIKNSLQILTEEEKDSLLKLAQGRPGILKKLLDNHDFMQEEKEFFTQINHLLIKANQIEKMKFVENIVKNEIKNNNSINQFLERLLHFLRSLLMEKIIQKHNYQVDKFLLVDIIKSIKQVNLAREQISKNINKRLILENLFLEI